MMCCVPYSTNFEAERWCINNLKMGALTFVLGHVSGEVTYEAVG